MFLKLMRSRVDFWGVCGGRERLGRTNKALSFYFLNPVLG